jgi:hypothetical protein
MSLETLRRIVREKNEKLREQDLAPVESVQLTRNEIIEARKKLYRDIGELSELLEKTIGEKTFKVEKLEFEDCDLPKPFIEFFESQHSIMPEDISYEVGAIENDLENREIFLKLKRRGRSISSIYLICYDRTQRRGGTNAHPEINLDYAEMQPKSTLERMKEIDDLMWGEGNPEMRALINLELGQKIFQFALKETIKHIQSV